MGGEWEGKLASKKCPRAIGPTVGKPGSLLFRSNNECCSGPEILEGVSSVEAVVGLKYLVQEM